MGCGCMQHLQPGMDGKAVRMPPLLWIVKTAESESLSHSEKKEQQQVFSQAQRSSRRRKAAEKQRSALCQRTLPKGEASSGQAYFGSDESNSDLSNEDFHLNQRYTLQAQNQFRDSFSTQRLHSQILFQEEGSELTAQRSGVNAKRGPLKQSKLGEFCSTGPHYRHPAVSVHRDGHGLRFDPFTPVSHQDSAFASLVIDFFMNVVVPSQNFFDNLFNVKSTYGRFVLQPIFQDDMSHAALVSFYSTLHQLQRPSTKVSDDVVRCTVKALSKHRAHLQHLDGRADELAIYTALQLTLFAEATGDIKSFNIHRSNIRLLLDLAGGFHSLPLQSHVRRVLPHWESFWSLGNETSFIFSDIYPAYVPCYPPYPFTVEIGNLVARLPPGFQELAKQRRMALDVLELLARVADTIAKNPRPADLFFNHTPSVTPISRRYNNFWEASPCLMRPNTADGAPDLERMIVLGLVLYCCHTFIPGRAPIMIYRAARQRLSADLTQMSLNAQDMPDVMLWVWMNVVDSWRGSDHELPCQAVQLLRSLKKSFPSVDSNAGLQVGLQKYMWNESFGERCKQYWDSISNQK